MTTVIKRRGLALSFCIAAVSMMRSAEHKRAESLPDQHDNPFLSPAPSLLCLSRFQSTEGRSSFHSIRSGASDEETSDSEAQEKCWHQVVCVNIPDVEIGNNENEQLVVHARNAPTNGALIPMQAINASNARPQRKLAPAPAKRSVLRRLLCCCCCN